MGAAGISVKQEADSTLLARRISAPAHRPWAASLLLFMAVLALYYPVHNYPFINFDDRDYIYENPAVQAGLKPSTIAWAFTTYNAGNWHPLTWMSHALDCTLFGMNPAGHHAVNVLFHAIDAVLLFWVLLKATGYPGRSFVVAALFALHPINVESVAWIAERKNVLSTMFFLLALGAYHWYALRPRVGRYISVVALFALGLMAKPQIITLPFVLMLWDYWPLKRLAFRYSPFAVRQSTLSHVSGERRTAMGEERPSCQERSIWWLLLEKVPLLAIAGASAVITMRAQHLARNHFERIDRVGNAILSYGLYMKRAIWPTGLTVLYPHPGSSISWPKVIGVGVLLLAITLLVAFKWRQRYLTVGWFWFLGTLVPMLGIVQVGVQAMADRYAYISFIGLFIMICWGAAELAQRWSAPQILLPSASVVWLLLLAVLAHRQITLWQSDEALWKHTLQFTANNWLAESQLGSALAMTGNVPEGVRHFQNALAINPDDANSNMGMGIYYNLQGNYHESVPYYEKALRDRNARSNFKLRGYLGLAKAYRALGETAKSQACLKEASKLNQ